MGRREGEGEREREESGKVGTGQRRELGVNFMHSMDETSERASVFGRLNGGFRHLCLLFPFPFIYFLCESWGNGAEGLRYCVRMIFVITD